MLTAEDAQQRLVNVVAAVDIEQLRQQSFYCPSCKEQVILKNGCIKIPHFAHKAHSHCRSFSEGETQEHLALKQLFYDWEPQNCRLEAVLPALSQRPDILYKEQLAIEVQCSPLSLQRLQERTVGYCQAGYRQWWLLGGQLAAQPKLTKLMRNFCCYDPRWGFHFWEAAAATKQLRLHYHLQEDWHRKQRWQTKVFHCEAMSLSELMQKGQAFQPHHEWPADLAACSACRRGLAGKLARRDRQLLPVQAAFYQQRNHLLALPSCLYAPSDFYLYFGDWLFYLRFLIYRSQQQEWKTPAAFSHFVKIAAGLDIDRLPRPPFPLVAPAAVWQGVFIETWRLLRGAQSQTGRLPPAKLPLLLAPLLLERQ